MRSIADLSIRAANKDNFKSLQNYLDFCQEFLEFCETAGSLQGKIVSRNENKYQFWQYSMAGNYRFTRPINSHLMYDTAGFDKVRHSFIDTLQHLYEGGADQELRTGLIHTIYTLQQSVGAALDGLDVDNNSQFAKKIAGDLFEKLIQLILVEMGITATSGVVHVPVTVPGEKPFMVKYQHDIILKYQGDVKAIGSVKTTSKDRIDKVFMDKFLYSKLTNSALPHIAIFLHDVQRKGSQPNFGIAATFLTNKFKGYTVRLNPLDGVYYCDIRPNMTTEPIIKDQIRTIDHLLCTDIWQFVKHHSDIPIEVDEEAEDE